MLLKYYFVTTRLHNIIIFNYSYPKKHDFRKHLFFNILLKYFVRIFRYLVTFYIVEMPCEILHTHNSIDDWCQIQFIVEVKWTIIFQKKKKITPYTKMACVTRFIFKYTLKCRQNSNCQYDVSLMTCSE